MVTSRHDDLAGLVDPRPLVDRAEAQDRGLARVDDRRAGVDAEDAHVGDREGAAGHLGRLRLTLAGHGGQLAERAGQLGHRHRVGVLDVGHDQAARGGGGDAEVDVVLVDDLLGGLVPERVDLRGALDRQQTARASTSSGLTLRR